MYLTLGELEMTILYSSQLSEIGAVLFDDSYFDSHIGFCLELILKLLIKLGQLFVFYKLSFESRVNMFE